MSKNTHQDTPYGITQDLLIRSDILRMENLSLQRSNDQLLKAASEQRKSGADLEARLEQMQAVLDGFALSQES